jgi:Rrf2 family protein
VVLKSIAERQGISENYLEQLFASLKKHKLVKSIRGSQGGYTLGDTPDKISVGDILRALEGSLAPVDCVAEDGHSSCSRYDCCVTRGIWQKIRDSINEVVDSTSLQQLVEEYKKSADMDDSMYFI